ncbi:hypothetical protein P1X14_20960, partial [Sphingomonas sp. AOB5]|uniref:hypothetical protein n=1 Tax=Sphingomonas sp. AOB5 TaxID=3034017 RepID=UPI0023F7C67F
GRGRRRARRPAGGGDGWLCGCDARSRGRGGDRSGDRCLSERRALADAALDMGGEAAADVLEADPGESYVPLPHNGDPYRGELLPVMEIEEEEV